MNWANLAVMKGQQAPAPSRVQALPSAPVNVAEISPQCDHRAYDHVGEIEADHRQERVGPRREQVAADPGDRAHRVARRSARPGRQLSVSATMASPLALDQRHAPVEPIHEGRRVTRLMARNTHIVTKITSTA